MKFLFSLVAFTLLLLIGAVPTTEVASTQLQRTSYSFNADLTAHLSKKLQATSRQGDSGPPRGEGSVPEQTGSCVPCAVEMFDLLNSRREELGISKFSWSNQLADLGTMDVLDMFQTQDVAASSFNYASYAGGLFGYEWSDAVSTMFQLWDSASRASEFMYNPRFKCIGIAFYGNSSSIFAIQLFSESCP